MCPTCQSVDPHPRAHCPTISWYATRRSRISAFGIQCVYSHESSAWYVVTPWTRSSPVRVLKFFWLYVRTQGTQMLIVSSLWTFWIDFDNSDRWSIVDVTRQHMCHEKINNSVNIGPKLILTCGSWSLMNSATPLVRRLFYQLFSSKSYSRPKITCPRKLSSPIISIFFCYLTQSSPDDQVNMLFVISDEKRISYCSPTISATVFLQKL